MVGKLSHLSGCKVCDRRREEGGTNCNLFFLHPYPLLPLAAAEKVEQRISTSTLSHKINQLSGGGGGIGGNIQQRLQCSPSNCVCIARSTDRPSSGPNDRSSSSKPGCRGCSRQKCNIVVQLHCLTHHYI